ncbi:MAG: SDR family oxidoreductase [Candidatus Omnitrophica bacterium]|nr:SDR family oxidoreductase [Candidatus Omnitrophota bacterium]
MADKKQEFPAQHQDRKPGIEKEMHPRPLCEGKWYKGSGKLKGKKAIITGGDSGIGRAISIFFAKEGADVSIVYYDEHQDARDTKKMVEEEGANCLLLSGDLGSSSFCQKVTEKTKEEFGAINILVNNAAYQPLQYDLETLTDQQLLRTFKTNIFSYFYMSRACIKYLAKGDTIINTSSVTAYRGSSHLLDYTSTKAAEIGFTRALAKSLAKREIRVNAVAPGPIWTPLTPSTFPAEDIKNFGKQTLMDRAGHPEEVAPSYVFLASQDASYFTGTVLHPNGGEIVNT